jgi:hypothetical protein
VARQKPTVHHYGKIGQLCCAAIDLAFSGFSKVQSNITVAGFIALASRDAMSQADHRRLVQSFGV